MNPMKKITVLLLTMTMLLCSVPTAAFGYSAASEEPNDVRSKATNVQPNTYSYGAINVIEDSDYDDVDWYKIIAPADGYVVADASPATSDIEADAINDGWVVEYYLNDDSDILYKESWKKNTESPRIAVSKGDVLYAKVYANDYYPGRVPENVSYKFRFSMTEDACWEKESNDTKSKSTVVTASNTYRGNIGFSGGYEDSMHYYDIDYWKYIVPDDGKFTLHFKKDSIDIEESDIEDGWDISLFANGNTKSFYSTTVKGESLISPNLAFKKGTIIYIRIEANDSYYTDAPGFIDYQLKITAQKSSKWENENNNTIKTAKKIPLGSTYYGNCTSNTADVGWFGTLNTPVDKDWYKFTATKTGTIGIYFGRKSIDAESKDGWDITVRTKGKILKTYSGKTSLYKASRRTGKFTVKKGQTVYIQIKPHTANLYDCPMGVDYSLKVKTL